MNNSQFLLSRIQSYYRWRVLLLLAPVLRIDRIHIWAVYFGMTILLPVASRQFYLSEWWVIFLCLMLILNMPSLPPRLAPLIIVSPLVSLAFHYIFWSIVAPKPPEPLDLLCAIGVTAWTAYMYRAFNNRRFDSRLETSEEAMSGFLERFNLSKREAEILGLIYCNKSTKEIAADLFISPETVRKHCQNIFQKTGSHSRVELLVLYTSR